MVNKPYIINRPYCYPENVLVWAKDDYDAIKQAAKQFGFCNNCKSEKLTEHNHKKLIIEFP